jgi:hypothetical protein
MKLLILNSAMAAAFITQALGHSGTCTQGNIGAFFTGLVLSAPFLLTAMILAAWTLVASAARHPMMDFSVFLIAGLIAAAMAVTNFHMVAGVFVGGSSACGPDHGQATSVDYAIAVAYGPAPALIVVLSVFVMIKIWRQYRYAPPHAEI